MEWILQMDNAILNGIQQIRTGFGDWFMPLVTKLGDAGIIWILLTVVLLCFRKTRKAGVAMAIGLIVNLIFCNLLIKPLVGRIRPFEANGFTDLLVSPPKDPSFPSGHSSASFAAASALFLYYKKWGIAALLLASLIAFSRLYLYVHYPTDVFCGILLGIVSGLLGGYVQYRWYQFRQKNASNL
ncbi:MAG: phosphatase PAP2 family protein [Candidatus Merdivicinus sp.]|jgi:undecaprenyl-diphosphatase